MRDALCEKPDCTQSLKHETCNRKMLYVRNQIVHSPSSTRHVREKCFMLETKLYTVSWGIYVYLSEVVPDFISVFFLSLDLHSFTRILVTHSPILNTLVPLGF